MTGGGSSVHKESEEIIEPDVNVKDDGKDWDLEGTLTANVVETSGQCSEMRAMQVKTREQALGEVEMEVVGCK